MSMTEINWYPGHMKKTKDLIKENIKLIDLVLEIIDARIPLSSKNPNIEELTKGKNKIIILNKADLVEKKDLDNWKKYFKNNKYADEVIETSAETGYNIKKIFNTIEKVMKPKKDKLFEKGLKKVNIRVIVLGIPNVGKSKIINRIVGKNSAGVGNKPGFTKGKQWIKIKEGIELLDTPGILWPKFNSEEVGMNLAITGSIRDEILPIEEVALNLINKIIISNNWKNLAERYNLNDEDKEKEIFNILNKVAVRMGILDKGGKANQTQAAYTILKDFRNQKLGKICLENLENKEQK